MELDINPKNLYPIKDGGFCKTLSNNKKHEKIARHVVKFMRGHFERCVNPTVVKDFGAGICVKFKFPLAPMGVLAPGSAHARPSARPPIDTSGNFSDHMSGGGELSDSFSDQLSRQIREF